MPTIPHVVDFTKCPNLGDAIKWAEGRPDSAGFTELLRATAAGRIAFTAILHRKARWSPHDLKTKLPIVVLIGDDKGASRDPADWRCSMSAIAWARSAIVHGCGAEVWHYRQAIMAAEITGRALFVETDSDHVAAWVSAIAPRGIPGLSIIPRAGEKHPIEAAQ
jgi:hypothetical protein